MAMTDGLLLERLALAAALALALAGVAGLFAASNATKRLACVAIGLIGAAATSAILGAPTAALIAVVAAAFGYVTIAAALTVRAQEAYGSAEAPDLDAADADDEAKEPQS